MRNEESLLRQIALTGWISQQLKIAPPDFTVTLLANDASFRRYFRVRLKNGRSLVAMDAQPEKENCYSFVSLAKVFAGIGINVPSVSHADFKQGFLLLTDLGDRVYFTVLNANNADQLYRTAMKELLLLQTCIQGKPWRFSSFNALMSEELSLFRHWYLIEHLKLELRPEEERMLIKAFNLLVSAAVEQPQVCVHRDYHSRNLMVLDDKKVGVLDFQDAVWGPITYDLVSLLRDCYIAWPKAQVEQWALTYFEAAPKKYLSVDFATFLRWFDWMGVQRHLKAMFIFARKFRRDNNRNYLADIPRTLRYVLDATAQYPELAPLHDFLQERVLPYENESNAPGSRTWPTSAASHG